MRDKPFKITLLGESTVGKTSLVIRLRDNKFHNYPGSTIGAAYSKFRINDHLIEMWDTAGQERFLSIVSMYYRGSDIVLLVFDVTKIDTVSAVHTYICKLRENLSNDCKLIIIGNKSDLISSNESIRILDKIKKEFDVYRMSFDIYYCIISTKTTDGISELTNIITDICKRSPKNYDDNELIDLNIHTKNYTDYIPNCGCW